MKTVFVNRRTNQARAAWTLRSGGARIPAAKTVGAHYAVKTALPRTKPQEIHQNFFNDVCGNNRDASVYGGDAKSKNPGRLVRVSGRRNSLRTAIEFRVADSSYSHWHRRFHWTQQNGQRIEATCFS
jgi:hypothetical protein